MTQPQTLLLVYFLSDYLLTIFLTIINIFILTETIASTLGAIFCQSFLQLGLSQSESNLIPPGCCYNRTIPPNAPLFAKEHYSQSLGNEIVRLFTLCITASTFIEQPQIQQNLFSSGISSDSCAVHAEIKMDFDQGFSFSGCFVANTDNS